MFHIGPHRMESQTALAPMAGVSDLPFRTICAAMGAGWVVSEMLTSETRLWRSKKSQARLQWGADTRPKVIQIAGSEAGQMAEAARACEDLGADIIDINMGCPAKKVCNTLAGSALLKDEAKVTGILNAVCRAVSVPVTLKTRTGWSPDWRNGVTIAKIAQNAGIAALTVHGRTRECKFRGSAEYDTIAQIVDAVTIPVVANGDIDSPQKAKQVLDATGAQAVMIGRAAQGNPWIFTAIKHYLATGELLPAPGHQQRCHTLLGHLRQLHEFYGEQQGVRIARKHLGWYLLPYRQQNNTAIVTEQWRSHFNRLTTATQQIHAVSQIFDRLYQLEDQAA